MIFLIQLDMKSLLTGRELGHCRGRGRPRTTILDINATRRSFDLNTNLEWNKVICWNRIAVNLSFAETANDCQNDGFSVPKWPI